MIILHTKQGYSCAKQLVRACRALNEKATILSTSFGDATLEAVLPERATAITTSSRTQVATAEFELMLNGINCGGSAARSMGGL